MRNKNLNLQKGFTLIELLVVIAIIALLSSVVLIGMQNARQKSRNVKRLQDMAQMVSGLELYFAYYKGYPSASPAGAPLNMGRFVTTIPSAPMPPDGPCELLLNPVGTAANDYRYVATGTPQTIDGNVVFPDYVYYFCLGQQTGSIEPGLRTQTPRALK